jgi:DNA-binding response OmpR family regulator/tetratricopeptide (TPR) repeat protein
VSGEGLTILLADDDRGAQRELAEALHDGGFSVLLEHDGDWAMRTFGQRQIDLVILEAVLPGRNGFQLALDIRRTEKGRTLPLMLMSSVYDSDEVKSQFDDIGAPLWFLEKPVEPAKVLEICRSALGLAQGEEPKADRHVNRERARFEARAKDLAGLADLAEASSVESDSQIRFRGSALVRGSLSESDFAEVLSEVHRWRATGALLIENAPVKKLIWIKEGAPVFVRSNLLSEALGQVLVRERMIKLAECEEALRRLRVSKRLLGTELIELGCISPANLSYALQLQVEQKLYDLFSWTCGTYRFNPRSEMPELQVALELTPARILREGIRRAYDDARVRRALGGVDDCAVRLTDDPLDRFQDMGLDPDESRLYALIDGKRTVHDLLDTRAMPDEAARKLLYALRCANMAHFAQPGERLGTPPPLPRHSQPPKAPGPRDREQVERLANLAQSMRKGTLFEVLGVRPDASELLIRSAFATLAKENHPGRLGPDAPAELRALAEDIFGQLALAHDTLTDRTRRIAYESELRSGVSRKNDVEVERILAAEQQFREGEELLKAKNPREALERYAKAAELYPEEAEFHACLGWATWLCLAPGEYAAAQARPLLDRAIQLNPRIDRAYVFRGRIARALGKTAEAEAEFEKALMCNPACAEALAELRLGAASNAPRLGAPPVAGKAGSSE